MTQRILVGLLALGLATGCTSTPTVQGSAAPPPRESAAYAEDVAGQNQRLLDEAFRSYSRGDFAKATNQFEAALLMEAQSQESWPRFVLFYCYLATGQTAAALTVAETLVRERPHDWLAYHQVGLARLWSGDASGAVASLLRAKEFAAHSPAVEVALAQAYRQMGRKESAERFFGEARALYEKALQANPGDFESNYELAKLLLFRREDLPRAATLIAAARSALANKAQEQLGPERRLYAGFYLPQLEGILLHFTGDYANSQAALLDAIAKAPSGLRPELAEIYHFIGRNFVELGQTESAVGFLERSLALDPKGPRSGETKGELRAIASRRNTGT